MLVFDQWWLVLQLTVDFETSLGFRFVTEDLISREGIVQVAYMTPTPNEVGSLHPVRLFLHTVTGQEYHHLATSGTPQSHPSLSPMLCRYTSRLTLPSLPKMVDAKFYRNPPIKATPRNVGGKDLVDVPINQLSDSFLNSFTMRAAVILTQWGIWMSMAMIWQMFCGTLSAPNPADPQGMVW